MQAKITYWTLGDSLVTRTLQLDDESQLQAAKDKLKDDPQEPLCQLDKVEWVEEKSIHEWMV